MTEPEEKPNPNEESEEKHDANMDEIVTETYDKSLHLSNSAPRLDPPGVQTPSIYDLVDEESDQQE